MARKKEQRQSKPRPEAETTEEVEANTRQELKSETDELLDEIDEILEQNAAEFVKNYVQKGGQ